MTVLSHREIHLLQWTHGVEGETLDSGEVEGGVHVVDGELSHLLLTTCSGKRHSCSNNIFIIVYTMQWILAYPNSNSQERQNSIPDK